MVYRGHGELPVGDPLGRPAQGVLGQVHPRQPGGLPRLGQGLEEAGAVVPLPAAGVQEDGAVRGVGQGQLGQSLPQGGIVVPGEEAVPGGGHALVVPRVLGVFLVGGEQVNVPRRPPVKAVALGAVVAAVLPVQGLGAQRAAKETFHGSRLPFQGELQGHHGLHQFRGLFRHEAEGGFHLL